MIKSGLKVAFVASSGGHLEELSKLREIEKLYDCFLVTERSEFMINDFCDRKYLVPKMSRKQITFLPKFAWLFIRTIQIMCSERPDFVITTGALIAYPFCLIGKLMGIKVVYIESFARVDQPSLTGKLVYNLSDLFMVQWEDMLNKYPKSMLGGDLF